MLHFLVVDPQHNHNLLSVVAGVVALCVNVALETSFHANFVVGCFHIRVRV